MGRRRPRRFGYRRPGRHEWRSTCAINTISLFSFVLAIGIVVDDAIVVAEHIQYERKQGNARGHGRDRGVRRIKVPLTFAVLTSVVAFVPLLFIPGGVGEVWRALPVIMIAMLLVSLVESLLVLPNHLSHLHGPEWVPANAIRTVLLSAPGSGGRVAEQVRARPTGSGTAVRDGPALGDDGGSCGNARAQHLAVAGGHRTLPHWLLTSRGISRRSSWRCPMGRPRPRTYEVAKELEAAGHRVIERLSRGRPEDAPPLLTGVTVTVGHGLETRGRT